MLSRCAVISGRWRPSDRGASRLRSCRCRSSNRRGGRASIPATRKVLQRAGLSIKDMDLVELNEAFAVQVLECVRELEIDEERLNVNGGSIALGHPLGCSGARLVVTLLHELERRGGRYGLATMCIGVGQGIATIIERMS